MKLFSFLNGTLGFAWIFFSSSLFPRSFPASLSLTHLCTVPLSCFLSIFVTQTLIWCYDSWKAMWPGVALDVWGFAVERGDVSKTPSQTVCHLRQCYRRSCLQICLCGGVCPNVFVSKCSYICINVKYLYMNICPGVLVKLYLCIWTGAWRRGFRHSLLVDWTC